MDNVEERFAKLQDAQSEGYNQLEMQLGAECKNSNDLHERHDSEITNCRRTMVQLSELGASDLDANERRWKAADSLMQDTQRKFEVGLNAAEARLEDYVPLENYESAQERINNLEERFAKLHVAHCESQDCFTKWYDGSELQSQNQMQEHSDLRTLLESERDAQVQDLNEHSMQLEDLGRRLRGECAERNLEFDELKSLLESELEGVRDELAASHEQHVAAESLAQEVHSKLETGLRTVEASVGKFTSALRSVHEQVDDGFAGLRRKIDDNDLLNGKNNQMRSGERERTAVKRVHDEHVSCINFDHDAALMQVAEVRRFFGEVNISEYRPEISNIVQEWQSLKKKFVTQLP